MPAFVTTKGEIVCDAEWLDVPVVEPCMGAAYDQRQRGRPSLPELVLLPAEVVPFTPQQHREAVMTLSGMMLTWLRNQRGPEPQPVQPNPCVERRSADGR